MEDCRGCLGGQGKVAELVDDQERGSGEEAHGGGPASFDGGAMAACGEVGCGGEVGAVARFHGGACQADRQHGLADARRPDEEHVGGGLEVAAGGEFVDELPVDAGGGVEVEVVQPCRGGQACEAGAAGEAARGVGGDFQRHEPFEGGGDGEPLGAGRIEHGWQVLGCGGELQCREVSAQPLVGGCLLRGGRRDRWCHCRVFLPLAAAV